MRTANSLPPKQDTNSQRLWIRKTTSALLNLINHQRDIDKVFLFTKDPYELKYQMLIENCHEIGFKYLKDPKVFIEYSSDMNDAYKNTNEYNPQKKRNVLIVYDC